MGFVRDLWAWLDRSKRGGPVIALDPLSGMYLTKGGYQRWRNPFDKGYVPYQSVVSMLSQDFEGFLNPQNIYLDESGMITHRLLPGSKFASDSIHPLMLYKNAKNDWYAWLQRYALRIAHFRSAMGKRQRITFVLCHNQWPHELLAVLKKKYIGDIFVVTLNVVDSPGIYQDCVHDDGCFYSIVKGSDHGLEMAKAVLSKHLHKL